MAFSPILACGIVAVLLSAPTAIPFSGSDVVGKVSGLLTAVGEKNARCYECSLGDAVADAVRASLGADIAIVCGGDLVQNLLPGDVTYDGIKAIFREDRMLATAQVTPKQLRGILEAGLSRITLDETESIDREASAYDGFPQISGFTMSYDASAPPGERVYEVRMSGKELDMEDDESVFTLAATAHMMVGGYGLPVVSDASPSDLSLSDAIVLSIQYGMADYLGDEIRIYPMGAQDGSLTAVFPVGIVVVVIFLILLGNGQRFLRMVNIER